MLMSAVQRGWGHRQQVSDEHSRRQHWESGVDSNRTLHLGVCYRHSVVSFRRSEVHDEVRLVDLRRHQDQPDTEMEHHRHIDLPTEWRVGPSWYVSFLSISFVDIVISVHVVQPSTPASSWSPRPTENARLENEVPDLSWFRRSVILVSLCHKKQNNRTGKWGT